MSAGSLKQSLWNKQFEDITKLLKKSLHSADKYSKKIFQDQEKFYRQFASDFIDALKKTQNFEFTLSPSKIYNQLVEKLKALAELFFPQKEMTINGNELRIRHYRIQRFLNLLQQEQKVGCRIHVENIRVLMQEQSKLNMKPELFIFKSYIIGEASELQAYRESSKSIIIKKQSFPATCTVKMQVLHGYFPDQALKIITANIPTLGTYKTVFNKAMQSKQVKEVRQEQQKQAKTLNDDNQTNSKTCFYYFGHAMQFDFFNSLFQPSSLTNYLRRFSIIEDTSICRGLILGAFQGLPTSNDPDLSDSDQEQRWEEEIDKMSRQFCSFFQGYFQEEQESHEVRDIARRIAGLRRKRSQNFTSILKKYWCKK